MLKSNDKLGEIFYWGKIFGTKADYYIAYGLKMSEFEFPSKTFYWAVDNNFEFTPLPLLTEDIADQIVQLAIDIPFTGEPTTVQGQSAENPDEPKPDEPIEGEPPKLTELQRLAQVVQEIDFDTAAVPKGAYALSEDHTVVPSSGFKGMSFTDATRISSYVHFRPPNSVAGLRALARTEAQFFANFLDLLEGDLPKGCWAIRQDPSVALVTLRSLSWPGYIAYHVPGTTKFGGMYTGYGQKCRDLPFLL